MALIKKRFWELEKKNVFQNPLYFEKSNLALVGPNLHSRTILQKQISFICMKAPRTERVAQISKKRPLSPNPNYTQVDMPQMEKHIKSKQVG